MPITLLATTAWKVQVVTAAGTIAVDISSSWVDTNLTTGDATPGSLNSAQVTGSATTDAVGTPSSGSVRQVKSVRTYNAHASNDCTVTFQVTDGTTTSTLYKATLSPGETAYYKDGRWRLSDRAGGAYPSPRPGRYLRAQFIRGVGTSATHTQVVHVGLDTTSILVRVLGGGGAGGGCTAVSMAAGAAGGGGAGAYAEKFFTVTPGQAISCVLGNGGVGSSGGAGLSGASTTVTVNGVTVTAPGGSGAAAVTSATAPRVGAGGAGGTVATNGDVNTGGDPGNKGVIVVPATPLGTAGQGGSSPYGVGGKGGNASDGAPAGALVPPGSGGVQTGFGNGGGGAHTGSNQARAGGNGGPGLVVIEEYA